MAKRTGEKFDAIIEAAVRVIAKYGYHQAQVSKIAKEAKVADGTIYLYFNGKDDILISLFQKKMGKFIARVKQEMDKAPTVEEKLQKLIYMHFKQLANDHPLAVVTQIELRQSNLEIRKGIRESLKAYNMIMEDLIQLGIEQGKFHGKTNIPLTRQMIFGTLDEVVTSWVMKEMKYDLLGLVDDVYFLLLHGLNKE